MSTGKSIPTMECEKSKSASWIDHFTRPFADRSRAETTLVQIRGFEMLPHEAAQE
jgi:hypothetical protein